MNDNRFVGGSLAAGTRLRSLCGVIPVLLVGLTACTQYHVLKSDAGSGGSSQSGTTFVTAAGGSNGSPGGAAGGAVDAAAPNLDVGGDRFDAPAVEVVTTDAAVEAIRDSGPTLLPIGTSCSQGTDCQFGNCVDGVCCESGCGGTCQACGEPNQRGKCVTITGTVRGTIRTACPGQGTCASSCNGSDPLACHYPGTEKQCAPAICSAGAVKAASTCNGMGSCTTVTSTPCASNLCAADALQCAGGCSSAQSCALTQYCEPGTNACRPLKANGDSCLQKVECASGACVDGVCCESLCGGQCEACGETGNKGKCIPVTGLPRGTARSPCAGIRDACRGTCDGVSRTQCNYPGSNVQCFGASCSNGTLTNPSICNSLGDCTTPTSSSCTSGQCLGTGLACLVCTPGLACAGGLVCSGNMGMCVSPAALSIAPLSPPSFASTPIGMASASQTFTVTNTGGVAAGTTTGLLPALSGTDAGEFRIATSTAPCTGTLAAGARCTVVVTFNPSSAGAKSATLTVGATPPASGSVSVTLTGTGLRRPGDTCNVTTDCNGGNTCVDGRCCVTASCGTCQACTGAAGTSTAGTCVSVPSGPDTDSCDGACAGGVCMAHGSILWARSTSTVWPFAVSAGASGVWLGGSVPAQNPANLGGAPVVPTQRFDAVLAMFAPSDAAHVASSRFGGSAAAGTAAVWIYSGSLDSSGAAIVEGTFDCGSGFGCSQIDLGLGLTSVNGGPGSDGYVGRYSVATGAPTWVAMLTGPSGNAPLHVATGANGVAYVSGGYREPANQNATLTFRVNGLPSASVVTFPGNGGAGNFVAALNTTTGAIGLAKSFSTGAGPEAMAWTGSEIVVSGIFAGTANFGVRTLTEMGSGDIFVAKLNPSNGSVVWVTPIGSTDFDQGSGIAVDTAGDIYVTGGVDAATTLGGFPIAGNFAAKLRNGDGGIVWARSFGSVGSIYGNRIAVGASKQVLAAGSIPGPLRPGDPFAGGRSAVLASFTSDGTPLWTKVIGTGGIDEARSVAAGTDAFYAAISLGANVGPTIEGVPIVGPAAPAGVLLKIQP